MPIGSALSGLRQGFTETLVLDAGVAYKNANIADMILATTSANYAFAAAIDENNTWVDPNGTTVSPFKLGATRGGMGINLGRQDRQVVVDGARFPIKGITRTDMMECRVTCGLLEMANVEQLQIALGSSSTTDYENFTKITPELYETVYDYIGNITIFATIAGRSAPNGQPLPIAVVLQNCRAMNIQEIRFEDKNEAVLQVDLVAHALDSDAFTCPMQFYVPKAMADLGYY